MTDLEAVAEDLSHVDGRALRSLADLRQTHLPEFDRPRWSE